MLKHWRDLHRHWEDWGTMALGFALVLAPWLARFSDSQDATLCTVIIGLAVLYFAQLAIARTEAWEEWITLALGLWLIVAPWTLGFADRPGAKWTHLALGGMIAALAVIELVEEFLDYDYHDRLRARLWRRARRTLTPRRG